MSKAGLSYSVDTDAIIYQMSSDLFHKRKKAYENSSATATDRQKYTRKKYKTLKKELLEVLCELQTLRTLRPRITTVANGHERTQWTRRVMDNSS